MKRYKLIILLLATAVCGRVAAQVNPVPYKQGEKIKFTISYRIGVVNTDVADVDFETTETEYDGTPVFNVHAYSTIYPLYKAFFDINDQYTTKLDKETIQPLQLVTELQEGSYRFSSRYNYDWDKMEVNTRYRNHKNSDYTYNTMKLQDENSYDGLSFFYNFRARDWSKFKKGDRFTINLVLEDTIRSIQMRFAGREVKNIKGYGRFKTMKFVCQLATSQGETFEDGSELFMWMSDDMNKIPIYMETPIRIGTIRARLTGYSGLKFPLSSKVN